MGVFSNLTTEGHEETNDRLGGFAIRETDAYLATIKMAYAGQSQGGAKSVSLVLTLPDGEYNETVYITNKQGENFFYNPNDKTKKVSLPGFTTINDICIVTTGKELHEQDSEEKVVKVYDYDEKKEMPKTVPVLVELLGKTFYVGLLKQIEDKNKKNESTGEYEPTGETRETNTIEKVFHDPSMITVPEGRKAEKDGTDPVATFYEAWIKKNKGVTRDKSKGGGGNAGNSGRPAGAAPTGAAGGPKKTSSLFGK